MVVAEIISVKPHPNADRLKVCSVDYGHDVAQVVTNAGNVSAGMKVIFAVSWLALLCACFPGVCTATASNACGQDASACVYDMGQ